jgi:hypothetical protein
MPPTPPADIEDIINFILSWNQTLSGDLRERLNSLRQIGVVSTNEPDERMNFAAFRAEGFLLDDHELRIIRNRYRGSKKLWHPRVLLVNSCSIRDRVCLLEIVFAIIVSDPDELPHPFLEYRLYDLRSDISPDCRNCLDDMIFRC